MTEIRYPRVSFPEIAICDANGELRLQLWQNLSLAGPCPFTLMIDGEFEWHMPLDRAKALASAARWAELRIDRAAERNAPPKPGVHFSETIPFDTGQIMTFELGTHKTWPHLYVGWGDLCIVPGPTKQGQLLIDFARLGEIASEMRDLTPRQPPGAFMDGLRRRSSNLVARDPWADWW